MLTLVDEKKQDITERIKTFEDACNELGDEHPFVRAFNGYVSHIHERDMNDYDLIAYLKLRIISAALNEGWEPQFIKSEERWYFWYNLLTKEKYDELSAEDKASVVGRGGVNANAYCGLVVASAFSASSYSGAYYSSRFAFKNNKLAKYVGRQFAEIYADFCFRPKSEEKKG